MTLREIRMALDKMDLSTPMFVIGPVPQNGALGSVGNLNVFRTRMASFDSVPFFVKEKQTIKNSFLFQTISDQLNHDRNQLQDMLRIAESIRLGAEALKGALTSILPAPDETTVVVKLPDAKDLEEVIGYLSTLQRSFAANVINSKINGQVSVKSWQPGSLWLDVYLGSAAAVTLVGGMVWSAAVIRKKQTEVKVLEKIVDSMEIKNQMLDGIRKGVEDHIQMVVESEAVNLAAHNFDKSDNREQIERLKMGIKDLAGLIEKGAEVHPALTAPEDVKNLFPDFTKLELIESKQKLIPENNSAQEKAP
jgi:hypothetical protein